MSSSQDPSLSKNSGIATDKHQYVTPVKRIKTMADMALWETSEAYTEYMGFIMAINKSIQSKSNSQGGAKVSGAVNSICGLLNDIDKIIDETPPVEQPARFGNQAFKFFYKKLQENLFDLLQKPLPEQLYRAVPEIMVYLLESFGNSTRIDYGTGHEMSFVMFLCCLFKIGFFNDADKVATGCKVFPRYLDLVRRLQQLYRMEPAGSHGVWSLDDYQFIPFIWGSSQLIDHPTIEPASFLKKMIIDQHSDDYMFLGCIKYINQVKTGPFSEHSNQLWNVSGVPSWNRVNGGLVKMYKAEVLAKFPVVQHIVFGTLLPLVPANPNACVRKMKATLMPSARDVEKLVFQPPAPPAGGDTLEDKSDSLNIASTPPASEESSKLPSVSQKKEVSSHEFDVHNKDVPSHYEKNSSIRTQVSFKEPENDKKF